MQSEPRYVQVADALSRAIGDGTFDLGSPLPTEMELCDKFDTSRHTIREALRRLQEQGMVKRRQGSGTVVISSKPRLRYHQYVGSLDDLMQYGAETRFEVLRSERIRVGEQLAGLLRARAGGHCIRLHGIRYARDFSRPVCITDVYRPIRKDQLEEQLQDTHTAVFVLRDVLDVKNIGCVEQTIDAVSLDDTQSRELEVAQQSPGLRTVRRYFDNRDRLLIVAVGIHPGEIFRYTSTLHRA